MKEQPVIYLSSPELVSAVAGDLKGTIDALLHYRSGVHIQQNTAVSDAPLPVGLIDEAYHSGHESRPQIDRLCLQVIRRVLQATGINLSAAECGLVISTTKGHVNALREDKGLRPDSAAFLSFTAEQLKAAFQMTNDPLVISNACISGVSALVVARRLIRSGAYRHVVVVGVDVLSHFITSGFLSFKSVSKNRCVPYDKRHDGLNLGEACGALLVSCERHTADDVLLAGGAITNDAHHISAPSRTGDGLGLAILEAMAEAGVTADDISFVNAHGTSTVYNDEMEAKAVFLAGLQDVPVNSTKPYFGHTLGASGVVDTILCMWELNHDLLFGTLGFESLGVSAPIKVCAENRPLSMKACVKTASGFGGCNAAVVLMRQDYAASTGKGVSRSLRPSSFEVRRTVEMVNGRLIMDGKALLQTPFATFPDFIRQAFTQSGDKNIKFYKKDDLAKLGYVASLYLFEDMKVVPARTGIVLANASASLHADVLHEQIIEDEGDKGARPSVFVYTLPNVTAGEICIRHGIQGENTFFICKAYSDKVMKDLEQYAALVMAEGKLDVCIAGWCELLDDRHYQAVFELISKK